MCVHAFVGLLVKHVMVIALVTNIASCECVGYVLRFCVLCGCVFIDLLCGNILYSVCECVIHQQVKIRENDSLRYGN